MTEVRIEMTCPGCEQRFLVAAAEQGKITECSHCGGWVDVPDLSRPPTPAELSEASVANSAREYDRQVQETNRQLEIAARQLEQYQTFLDHRDRQDARFDQVLDRLDTVIARWEQLAEQMGRVVGRLGDGGRA